jgi:hypothetical protein
MVELPDGKSINPHRKPPKSSLTHLKNDDSYVLNHSVLDCML